MIWVLLVVLAVVLAGAAVVVGKKGGGSTINQGTRAVIVPTADATRTVVVAPCGTGTKVASPNAAAIESTTGSTRIELPRGQGVRLVLVPRCGGGSGASAGTSRLPSAAFVPKPGTPVPPVKPGSGSSGSTQVAEPGSAQFHLTVPNGSPIRTVVVGPCEKPQASGPSERILSPAAGSDTAVAPSC